MARTVTAATPLPPRGPGRPPRALGAQLADQILDAAQRTFWVGVSGATTVEEIAARIGATKRTIYVRFTDKAQLFRAVVTRVLDAKRPRLSTIGTDQPVDDRLTDMGLALLRYVLDPDVVRVLRVVTAEAYPLPRTQPDDRRAGRARRRPRCRADTGRIVQLGRIEQKNIPFATTLLLSLLTGAPAQETGRGAKPLSPAGHQRWVRGAVSLFLDGTRSRRISCC